MKELFNIFFVLLSFILICIFPINAKFTMSKLGSKRFNFFDFMNFNLLLNLFFLFFLSFTYINYTYYFYFILMLSILFNTMILVKNKDYFDLLFKNKKFFFFVFLNIVLFLTTSSNPTMSWDGIENWYFKAQIFYQGKSFFELKDTLGHAYYPQFGSFLWGFFWKNSILEYEYVGRLFIQFIYIFSIFSISDLITKKRLIEPIFITLIVILTYDDFLFGGYQDTLIFSFLILATKYLYLYFKDFNKYYLIFCFVLINFLPWIKNEGYIFVLIFLFSLLCIIKFCKKKIHIIFFVIFSVLFVLIKFFIFYKYLYLNPTHGSNLSFNFEYNNLITFLKIFLFGLIVAIFKYKIWLILIPIIFYIFYKKKITKKDFQIFIFLKINLILYVAMLFFIYFDYMDERRGLYWWIHTTLDRLIYCISGVFIIAIVLFINNFDKFYKTK